MDVITNIDMNRDMTMTMAMTVTMFMCPNVNMNIDHRLSDYGLTDQMISTIKLLER
jgi:hypothetical protein